jgi:hypothetical protein
MKNIILHVELRLPDDEFDDYMNDMKRAGMSAKDFVETFVEEYTNGVDDVTATFTFDKETNTVKKQ